MVLYILGTHPSQNNLQEPEEEPPETPENQQVKPFGKVKMDFG